jgi:hypothetical protein
MIVKQQQDITKKKVQEFMEIKRLLNKQNLIDSAQKEEIKKQNREKVNFSSRILYKWKKLKCN